MRATLVPYALSILTLTSCITASPTAGKGNPNPVRVQCANYFPQDNCFTNPSQQNCSYGPLTNRIVPDTIGSGLQIDISSKGIEFASELHFRPEVGWTQCCQVTPNCYSHLEYMRTAKKGKKWSIKDGELVEKAACCVAGWQLSCGSEQDNGWPEVWKPSALCSNPVEGKKRPKIG